MREKKLAFYQTEVRRVFCPSPRPTSWRLAQTEIERRIVALKRWNALDDELKAIVQHACATEANYALAEMERLNALALASLTGEHHVKLAAFPADLVAAARKQAADVLGEIAARSALTDKIHRSYADFRARTAPWSRVSIESVLRARG